MVGRSYSHPWWSAWWDIHALVCSGVRGEKMPPVPLMSFFFSVALDGGGCGMLSCSESSPRSETEEDTFMEASEQSELVFLWPGLPALVFGFLGLGVVSRLVVDSWMDAFTSFRADSVPGLVLFIC